MMFIIILSLAVRLYMIIGLVLQNTRRADDDH
jgi:hypothetical protein